MRAATAVRVLTVLGAVLAALGLIAGHLNRELLDGPTFARHVDEIRRDDDVAAAVGQRIADQLIASHPDLIAIRPLVEQTAVRVVGGDRLSRPTRAAATAAHTALTESDADSIVLRITDAAAVVTGVLAAVAPERAPVSSDVSVTLASLGDQAFASTTIALARALGVLAWLLPVLAVVCFVAAVLLSSSRWRAAAGVGKALVWAAGAVGLLLLVGGYLVRQVDTATLDGALVAAAWRVMVRPLWWGVALLAGFGLALMLAADSSAPAALARRATVVRAAVLHPTTAAGVAVRAVVAVFVGIAAIRDPGGMVELLAVVGGVCLVLFAITEIGRLAAAGTGAHEHADLVEAVGAERRTGRSSVVVAAVLGLAVLAGVVWLAWPGRDVAADATGDVVTGDGTVCNGHAELCDRRFDEVAYVAAHNAMSVATEPGWFLAEQSDPIPVQLDQGVRVLLVDVWSGISAGSVVRTAPGSYDEARTIAEGALGPEVVDAALRIADSIAPTATGPEARYLCHGLCETGSTPLLDVLTQLRGWLVSNPDEVVTLFIEDHVAADLIAADVEVAGLVPFVHEPLVGEPWPTLGEMIRSGERLVVLLEEGSGGATAPWLANGFDHVQDTPYTFASVQSFNCDANRGTDGAPLLLVNHWLSGFSSLVSNATIANAADVLGPRVEQCVDERQFPNFVAVNYVAIGDVYAVVDGLNGVT
jgi:hypothetical protein